MSAHTAFRSSGMGQRGRKAKDIIKKRLSRFIILKLKGMNQLVQEVENDIREFIKQQEELLFNEFDFQMQLAIYLRMSNKYDDVDSEYYMPTKKGKRKKKMILTQKIICQPKIPIYWKVMIGTVI